MTDPAHQSAPYVSPAAWQQQGQYFAFNGQQIFYRDSGIDDKPVLLLIHGFPNASWDWQPIWPTLEAHFRVIAPDMLGFGFSSKPQKHQYSIHEQADIHVALLAHLGIQQCHALVHDYGVSVMQELLARQIESSLSNLQFVSACFLNGGLYPEMHRARFVQKLMLGPLGPLLSKLTNQGQFNRSFSAVFGPNTQPSKQELADFWALIKHEQGDKLFHRLIRYMKDRKQHRNRWVHAIENPGIPVRLINGPEDPVSGRHLVEYYANKISNADVVLLEGIGHYPQVEAPQAVLKHFLEFYKSMN